MTIARAPVPIAPTADGGHISGFRPVLARPVALPVARRRRARPPRPLPVRVVALWGACSCALWPELAFVRAAGLVHYWALVGPRGGRAAALRALARALRAHGDPVVRDVALDDFYCCAELASKVTARTRK